MPSEPIQHGRNPAKWKAPAIGKVVRTGKELGGSSSNLASMGKKDTRDIPGGPVANTPHSQCRGPRLNPWSGNRSHMLLLRLGSAK